LKTILYVNFKLSVVKIHTLFRVDGATDIVLRSLTQYLNPIFLHII